MSTESPSGANDRPDDPRAEQDRAPVVRAPSEGHLLTDYRLRQRDYLLHIGRAMNAQRDLADVLSLVIRSAVTMTNGQAGAIALRPPGGGEPRLVASYRLEGRFEHDLAALFPEGRGRVRDRPVGGDGGSDAAVDPPDRADGDLVRLHDAASRGADQAGLAGDQARDDSYRPSGQACDDSHRVSDQVRDDSYHATGLTKHNAYHGGDRAEPDAYHVLDLPLRMGDEAIGRIVVFRSEGAAVFTPLDGEVLQTFADQAAVAIRNAYLHERLAARERQLAELVEMAPGGILLADGTGRVVGHNPAACSLLGRAPAEVAGAHLVDLLAMEGETAVVLPNPGTTTTSRGYLARAGGGRGPFVQATLRALPDGAGGADSYVANVADISAFKETEDAKTAFLAGLSHELKTPLALIQGFAETLRLDDVREDASLFDESVDVILQETGHLTDIVEQLLQAARLQSGAPDLAYDVVDVGWLLGRTVEAFRATHPDHEWVLDVAAELPPITADPSRLRQVVGNLFSNAAKYAPAGTRVTCRAWVDGPDMVIAVEDEGPGIAPGDADRIFQRFVRASDRGEGAGLGLYMSRAIVEAHGGTIDVQSVLGRGSTFTVRLPREPRGAAP